MRESECEFFFIGRYKMVEYKKITFKFNSLLFFFKFNNQNTFNFIQKKNYKCNLNSQTILIIGSAFWTYNIIEMKMLKRLS